jgi:hypothetical protein
VERAAVIEEHAPSTDDAGDGQTGLAPPTEITASVHDGARVIPQQRANAIEVLVDRLRVLGRDRRPPVAAADALAAAAERAFEPGLPEVEHNESHAAAAYAAGPSQLRYFVASMFKVVAREEMDPHAHMLTAQHVKQRIFLRVVANHCRPGRFHRLIQLLIGQSDRPQTEPCGVIVIRDDVKLQSRSELSNGSGIVSEVGWHAVNQITLSPSVSSPP